MTALKQFAAGGTEEPFKCLDQIRIHRGKVLWESGWGGKGRYPFFLRACDTWERVSDHRPQSRPNDGED